jgi:CrcB protein
VSLYVGVAVAGALGAPLRYLVDTAIQRSRGGSFPLGTMVINVTGSLALGFLSGLALYHAFPSAPATVLGTGFCGAYTTFSTLMFETVRLAEEEAHAAAVWSVAGNLLPGVAAAAMGMGAAALI